MCVFKSVCVCVCVSVRVFAWVYSFHVCARCVLCRRVLCVRVALCLCPLASLTHEQEAEPPQDGAATLGLGGLAQTDAGQRHQQQHHRQQCQGGGRDHQSPGGVDVGCGRTDRRTVTLAPVR